MDTDPSPSTSTPLRSPEVQSFLAAMDRLNNDNPLSNQPRVQSSNPARSRPSVAQSHANTASSSAVTLEDTPDPSPSTSASQRPSSRPQRRTRKPKKSKSSPTPPITRPPPPAPTTSRTYANAAAALMVSLTKNWIPHQLSPQEVQGIRSECDQRRQLIQALEFQQKQLHPFVDQRVENRLFISRVDLRIRYFRIFRMNELPTEIIANIFRYVVWSCPNPHQGILWRLWLTWTCRHWRTIAIADSTLWNAIWFRDAPPFERSLVWFDRAGTAPLDLRINDQNGHHFTDKEMEQLLNKLFTKLSYIRMLIIIVTEWEPVLTVLDKLRSAARTGTPLSIERFELHRTGNPYVQLGTGFEPALREPMALFGGVPAPSLRYFSINGIHLNWHQSILTNLTTLDIRRIPLELSPGIFRFRELLTQSPGLLKLCLDGAGPIWQGDEARGLPPIKLLHLKTLVIADFSLHYALYVIAHISAPHVRDLTLMNFIGEDYSPLYTAMTACFPEVRLLTAYTLEVVHTPRVALVMVKWLESMPLLSYLRIANVDFPFLQTFLYDPRQVFGTVASLNKGTASRTLCPKLDVLECQSIDPAAVADWGAARQRVGGPLRKIYVTKDVAERITPENHQALTEVASLSFLDYGSKTPEEEEILL